MNKPYKACGTMEGGLWGVAGPGNGLGYYSAGSHPENTFATPGEAEKAARAIEALAARIDGATIVPAPEWASVPEAAARLGVSPQTVRRWIAEGRIEARGHGRLRRVRVG